MMSLSARPRRILRSAPEHSEVFVLGETTREVLPAAPVATAEAMLASAAAKAQAILREAHHTAAQVISAAESQAASVRDEAFAAGFAAGQEQAADEVASLLELLRKAVGEAKAIRDDIAGQSAGIVARAAAIAARRIVAAAYDADPELTPAICAEALKAAASQEVLSIRVSPGLVEHVQATLLEHARYVVPDEAIAIGGCVIDLRNGTIDATLDKRLALMDLAIARAGGVDAG